MQCTILSSAFDVFVQGVLALLSFLILVGKWWFEKPRRPVKVAAMDGSKQGGGFAIAHVFNMYFSLSVVATPGSDPCQWYFVNIMLDTTARVYITYAMFRATQIFAEKRGWGDIKSGEYGDPPDMGIWAKQLSIWLVLVSLSKIVMGAITYAFRDSLFWLSGVTLAPLKEFNDAAPEGTLQSRSELLVVMIVTPFVMNTFQLIVQDNFLKAMRRFQKALL